MPSLIVFERRTIFAGDDLQPSSLLTILVRFCQTCFFLIPLTIDQIIYVNQYGTSVYSTSGCSGKFTLFLTSYIAVDYLYFLTSVLLEWRIYQASGIGTPIQPGNRQEKVGKLVEVKSLPMVVWNTSISILGLVTVAYASQARKCYGVSNSNSASTPHHGRGLIEYSFYGRFEVALWILFVVLVATQLTESIFSIYSLIRLLCKQKVEAESDHLRKLRLATSATTRNNFGDGYIEDRSVLQLYQDSEYSHEVVEEMWDHRCRFICRCFALSSCYLFGGRHLNNSTANDFKDISTALADYFENIKVIDVVPSDILIGFLMLQKVQKQRIIDVRNIVLNEKKQNLPATAVTKVTMTDRLTITDAGNHTNCETSNYNRRDKKISSLSLDEKSHAHSPSGPLLQPTHDTAFMTWRRVGPGSSSEYEAKKHEVLRENDLLERAVIAEGARFSRYALAIYTWVLHVYMHPISGPCRLLWSNLCKFNHKKRTVSRSAESPCRTILIGKYRDGDIVGDNFLKAHESSLLSIAGINKNIDLIHANFTNDCNKIPFCVLADHEWESVVLSIRGTLSLEDLLVDGSLSTESLEELGNQFDFDGKDERCHTGILSCAKYLHTELETHGILESLLDGIHAVYPNYTLRVVGHSVGAGIATILSLMLRKKYPTLRCLAYSPPGQFLTKRLAMSCKEFCTSFVLDSDFIPRLTVLSMENLRNDILDMIGRLKVSKKEAMNSFVQQNFSNCSKKGDDEINMLEYDIQRMLHSKDGIPRETEFYSQLQTFHKIVNERKQSRGQSTNVGLYPPGQIIHLVKTGQKNECCAKVGKCLSCGMSNAGSEYTPVWAENDDFNEIIVSETMWTDHFPNRVCVELEKIASSFDIDSSSKNDFEIYENSVSHRPNIV